MGLLSAGVSTPEVVGLDHISSRPCPDGRLSVRACVGGWVDFTLPLGKLWGYPRLLLPTPINQLPNRYPPRTLSTSNYPYPLDNR